MQMADVPAPRSWVTGDLSLLRSLAEETTLIIKPHLGHRGAGIHFVRNPNDLAKIPQPESPIIIQEFIEGTGEDLKIYVVGEEVFGVKKPFSESSFTVPGRPVPISDEVRQLSLRVGKICGLGLYGLDIIESPRGPYVVDVNFFPGYKGVPDVAPLIADYIDGYAQGRFGLNPAGQAESV
jgi:ribosomal protein S6--L-glutamate ligase